MVTRLLFVLSALIGREQFAFVSSKCIADNIFLTHELVHGYQSCKGSPQYTLKVDLMKAFDLVE